MSELVSVILATYNTERFICEAIASVLGQTYRNLELIVVDDGSTDGTRQRIEPLLADSRARYVYQPNAGQPAADNHGLTRARGSLIAFIDADDVWAVDKLARQVPLFANEKVGVVYSPAARIDEHGRPLAATEIPRYTGQVTERLFVHNFVPFSSSVVRRRCFDRIGMFDTTLRTSYDYDLWLRISTEFEFAAIDEAAVYYREWAGQMTHNRFRLVYGCGIEVMRRFQAAHPHLMRRSVIRNAWANTYVGRAYFIRKYERATMQALADYGRALRANPRYLPAYKGIAETLVRPGWRSGAAGSEAARA